jgi:hypothetical protein
MYPIIYFRMPPKIGMENWDYGCRDPSRWPRGTHYPQKLALTSLTSGSPLGRYSSGLRPRSLVFIPPKMSSRTPGWRPLHAGPWLLLKALRSPVRTSSQTVATKCIFWGFSDRFLAGGGDFCIHHLLKTASGTLLASYPAGTGDKITGAWSNYSLPSSYRGTSTFRSVMTVGCSDGPLRMKVNTIFSFTDIININAMNRMCDSGLEIREYGRRDTSRWPRGTLYPQ